MLENTTGPPTRRAWIVVPMTSRLADPSKSRDGVKRIGAQRRHVVERVVAVAGPLAGEDDARLPGAVGRPQQLALGRERRAVVDVVAR